MDAFEKWGSSVQLRAKAKPRVDSREDLKKAPVSRKPATLSPVPEASLVPQVQTGPPKKLWRSFKELKKEAKNKLILQIASGDYKSVGTYTRMKIRRALETLNVPQIDLQSLRVACCNGAVEDCRGLRSTMWKLLLYHLPTDSGQWEGCLEARLREYNDLKAALFPGLMPSSKNTEDAEIWEDVEKDIRRTRPDVAFFAEPLEPRTGADLATMYEPAQCRKCDLTPEQQAKYILLHGDIMGRLLYIYAVTHKQIKYVQGMNELLAVLYYVYAKDCIPGYQRYIESDAYWSFVQLMEELSDLFNCRMDNTFTGIRARIAILVRLIKRHRPNIDQVLTYHSVDPPYLICAHTK